MRTFIRVFVAAASMLPAACATPGGGPLGFVALDPNRHVAAAEPLMGRSDEKCFNDAALLARILDSESAKGDEPKKDACELLVWSAAKAYHTKGLQTSGPEGDKLRRNLVMDALMANSEVRCGSYKDFLQQYDANVNSTFGIAAQVAPIVASITSGGTAQALAAGAGIAAGTRGTLNNAHFSNKAVAILIKAFDSARETQRTAIAEAQKKPAADYTLMAGMRDAFRYHSSCSVVMGLLQTQRAVEQANSPSLETMSKLFEEFNKVQDAAKPKTAAAPAATATTAQTGDGQQAAGNR